MGREVTAVSRRLKDMRTQADHTLRDIGQILYCQPEAYREYEAGIRAIPVWTAIRLAQYAGISADYLLDLTQKRRPYLRLKGQGKQAGPCATNQGKGGGAQALFFYPISAYRPQLLPATAHIASCTAHTIDRRKQIG